MKLNAAWMAASMIACILPAWLRLLALDCDLARAEPKALRILHAAARGGSAASAFLSYLSTVASSGTHDRDSTSPGPAADLVAAAADTTDNPALWQAADDLARTCRACWGRIPAPSRSGATLRTASYLLATSRGNPGRTLLTVLVTALIKLGAAIARLRENQQHAAQARAACDAVVVMRSIAHIPPGSLAPVAPRAGVRRSAAGPTARGSVQAARSLRR